MSIPNDAFKTLLAPWNEVIEAISKDEDLAKRVKTMLNITHTVLTTLEHLRKCSTTYLHEEDLSKLIKKIDFEISVITKNKEALSILNTLLSTNADVKLQQTFTKIDEDNFAKVKRYVDCANLVFSVLEKRSSPSDKAKRNISLIKENKEKILRLQKTMLAANAALQQLSEAPPAPTPFPPKVSASLPPTPPTVTTRPSATLTSSAIKSEALAVPTISVSLAPLSLKTKISTSKSRIAASDLLAVANAKMNKIKQDYPVGIDVKDLTQAVEVFKQCDEAARLFFKAGKELEGAQAKKFALDLLQGPASHPEHVEWKCKLASEIFAKMSKEIAENPDLFTSVHFIYDEAANDYLKENDIKAATAIRVLAASKFRPTETHPLHNVRRAMEAGLTVMEAKKDRRLGAHFSHLGGGTVDSGLVRIEDRKIENDKNVKTCIDFDLTRPARKQLQELLDKIYIPPKTILDLKLEMQIEENMKIFCNELSRIFKGQVTIKSIDHILRGYKNGIYTEKGGYPLHTAGYLEAIEIVFEGVGKVIINNNDRCGSFYNHITLELDGPATDSSETLQKAQCILSVLGLGAIFGVRPSEEELRLKVSVLYRSHFPQQLTKLQEDLGSKYFEMPVAELVQTIQTTTGAMKDIFNNVLGSMKTRNIYPGREVWVDPEIVERVKKAGAWGFIQGLGDYNGENHEKVLNFMKLAINLKLGPLSSSERFYSTISVARGSSTNQDFASGGGDQVFVRMITQQLAQKVVDFSFSGSCQVIYSPRLAERIGYAYSRDSYGVRNPESIHYDAYLHRLSLDELASILTSTNRSNEAMIRENIDMGEYLVAVMVRDNETKDIMRAVFLEVGILKINENGEEIVHIGDGTRIIPFNDLVLVCDEYKKDCFIQNKKNGGHYEYRNST